MPRRKSLSLKQKRFVKHYLGDAQGNAAKAAIMAGYEMKRENASRAGFAALNSPMVQKEIQLQLDRQDLGTEYVSNVLREVIDKDNLRRTKTSDVLRAVDMVMKLKGAYPAKQIQSTNLDIRTELKGKSTEELEEELAELRAEQERIKTMLRGDVKEGEVRDAQIFEQEALKAIEGQAKKDDK